MTLSRSVTQMLVSREIGGAAKLAFEISTALRDRGELQTRLLIPGGGGAAQNHAARYQHEFKNYNLDALTHRGVVPSSVENISMFWRVAGTSSDILHIHSPFVFGAMRLFRRFSPMKTLLHMHLDYSVEQLHWPLKSPPDQLLLCAHSLRESVESAYSYNKLPVPEIYVIPNAIDHEVFYAGDAAAAKKKVGIGCDKTLIVLVGNLSPHKGQETAIRAMQILVNSYPDARLWLVGSDRTPGQSFRESLAHTIDSAGLVEQVTLTGFRDDVPDILRAADYLVLPSTSEAMPLGILEAQASNAVVLAAPAGDTDRIVKNGETGFIVPADDARGYATVISQLIENNDMRLTVAKQAREYVSKYHQMDRYCTDMCALYQRMLLQDRT